MKSILFSALLSLSIAAQAQTITFVATLDGPSEATPNSSPATGTATITYDGTAKTLRVQANYSGLTAAVSGAHIHAATAVAFTGTAGVATRTPTFLDFPTGTSGTYDHTYDLTVAGSYNPAFVTASGGIPQAETNLLQSMLSGKAYFNIHTANFPGGEIRGFLVPLDSDEDLIPDYLDAFPNSRDVGSTVKIGSCDTGVPSVLVEDGATISDLIYELGTGVRNHGQFVSRVAKLKKELVAEGLITAEQAEAIQSCAARTKQL